MGRSSFSGFGGALSGTGGASRQNIRATMAGMGTVRPWMTELQRKKSTGGMSRVSDSEYGASARHVSSLGPCATGMCDG
jgi:hypothetical protein